MLLAFLSDKHAGESLSKLVDSVGDAEKVYLNRLIETIGELRTCRAGIATEGARRRLSACITNTTDNRAAPVDITFRALDKTASLRAPEDPPPEVLMEWTFGVPGGIEARRGVEVRADVDLAGVSRPPAAFEAFARQSPAKPE
jgi:hypothetical protein